MDLHRRTRSANGNGHIITLGPSNNSKTRLHRRPQKCIVEKKHNEATAMTRAGLLKRLDIYSLDIHCICS